MTAPFSAPIRSFGRTQGRKLRKSHNTLVETLLPKLLITLPLPTPLFTSPAPFWFEIGFGGGEHLVEQAQRNPGINFIGCEPYINGMAKLLAAIDAAKLTNVRLYDGDARLLLEQLPDASIERIFVLFPDPWPKTRHHKRRLISQETLALFKQKLIPGGLLRIATDHAEYGTWILEQLLVFGGLEWQAKRHTDWQTSPDDWVPTRYQAKAATEGREPLFLDWKHPL